MRAPGQRGWARCAVPRSEGRKSPVGLSTVLFVVCLGLMFCYVAALMLVELPGCVREIVRTITEG